MFQGHTKKRCLSNGQKVVSVIGKTITILTDTLILQKPPLHNLPDDVAEQSSKAPKQPQASILHLGGATPVVDLTRHRRKM